MSRTYKVSFFNMIGECLGVVEVCAASSSKAKALAASIYTCSWTSQAAEVAL